jgi:transcriptional regulator with XRE-family HTH domain
MENSGTPPTEKDPVLVRFGETVRRLRKERKLSQESFGAACEIDRSYMGGIERGEHNLALINIMKIVKGLNIQPSEFFKELDEPRQSPAG